MGRCKVLINPRHEALRRFVEQLPDTFDVSGRLLHDGRNQVRLIEAEGQSWVVKRYKVPMWHQRLDYTFFRPSKARRAYLFGLRLTELHIDTPEPVACLEQYSAGLFRVGYFVSAYCPDASASVLRDQEHPDVQLTLAIAHALADMHQKGVLHGDTNLSNFLYRADDSQWGYHITTIDVNRSKFGENLSFDQCTKNLCRVTHVRPLLQQIVEQYAQLRGWDPQRTLQSVIGYLDAFERKRALRKKFK
ncbi:MAG: lipopolysaccharide kinase InaA family protein [Bacteroidales bacterium]|nr:lipopolysaccharide kinase InaA family protein [Bacteroidales bacterium]